MWKSIWAFVKAHKYMYAGALALAAGVVDGTVTKTEALETALKAILGLFGFKL